jgi:glycosyltransferase involved in cell wall biosynthesis
MNASIAVVIPVRNGEAFLDETFASIWAQNYTPLEVVVVDDGSTDRTRTKIRSMQGMPVRLLEAGGVGPAAARNQGIRASESELVAFLDCDDLWVNGALHRLAKALAEHPEAGIAQGMIRNFSEPRPGNRMFVTPPYRFFNLGASLWRRSIFETVGLLDEDLRLCEDLDITMRCWEQDVRKVEVESVVLHYRRHPGGMTHGLSGAGFGSVKAYKKRIDRIRSGLFKPNSPRHIDLHRYLGATPGHQDGSFHAPTL